VRAVNDLKTSLANYKAYTGDEHKSQFENFSRVLRSGTEALYNFITKDSTYSKVIISYDAIRILEIMLEPAHFRMFILKYFARTLPDAVKLKSFIQLCSEHNMEIMRTIRAVTQAIKTSGLSPEDYMETVERIESFDSYITILYSTFDSGIEPLRDAVLELGIYLYDGIFVNTIWNTLY